MIEPSTIWSKNSETDRRDEIMQLIGMISDDPIDLIRSITDPEHPLTLEQLAVVSAAQIKVYNPPRPGSKSTRGVVTEVNNSIANEDGTALSMEAQDREGKIGEESKVDVDGGEDARILVEFTPSALCDFALRLMPRARRLMLTTLYSLSYPSLLHVDIDW